MQAKRTFHFAAAVPANVYDAFFQRPFARIVIRRIHMNIMVSDIRQEVIEAWMIN